jgi:hypothetical protein
MGLLDMLNTEQGMLGMSLLAAAAPQAGPRNTGAGLLGALGNVQAWRDGNARKRAEEEDRAMRREMQTAQLGEIQAQAQQRQAALQAQQRAAAEQQAFLQALQGQATTPQQALAGGGGPTPQNAAQIGAQAAPDFATLARRFPGQVDVLQKLAGAGDWGRAEVARMVETVQNGRPVQQAVDKFNRPIGDPMAQWKAPIQADTGGAVNFLDPVSLQRIQSLGKTMTPDGAASNAIARANLDLSRQRLAFDQQQPRGQYDAERGLLIDPRTGVATPVTQGGAPIGAKPSEAVRKELMSINQQRAMVDGAIKAVRGTPDAFSLTRGTATMVGPIAESVAGRFDSDAQRQARAFVYNNVSAVINERAGAAQSAQELARLRSFLPAETDNAEQITSKLQAFQSYLSDKERGTTGAPSPAGGQPRIGEVRRGYVYRGGDPSQQSSWEKQ